MTERIGVLGGTFDPVHIGHLMAAEEVRFELGLDRVLFVPAARPPHKLDESVSAPEHRVAMLELAIAGNPAFGWSPIDLEREGPHYTVDMLRLLQAANPSCEHHFIMGSDSLLDLPNWRSPQRIIELAVPVVVDRPGYAPDVEHLEDLIPGLTERLRRVPMPLIGISSSEIEQRVLAGRPIKYQVPADVEGYIHRHGLYVTPTPSAETGSG